MQQKKTNIITPIIIIVAIFVLLIGGVIAYSEYGGDGNKDAGAPSRIANDNIKAEIQTDEKSDDKTKTKEHIKYTATNGSTALDQLLAINDTVVVEESEYGKMITSINDLTGGTDGKYWSFYVDGEMAQVGADAFSPQGGEVIEWKFQAL